jgi:hypothetical protein
MINLRYVALRLDRTHAACMPDTAWAVNGYLPDSSRDRVSAPVLMSSNGFSTRQRQRTHVHRSSSRSTPDAITATPFPTTFKTTVFSQCPSRRFEATARTTAPEGQPPSPMQHRSPRSHHPHLPRFPRSCSQTPTSTPPPRAAIRSSRRMSRSLLPDPQTAWRAATDLGDHEEVAAIAFHQQHRQGRLGNDFHDRAQSPGDPALRMMTDPLCGQAERTLGGAAGYRPM